MGLFYSCLGKRLGYCRFTVTTYPTEPTDCIELEEEFSYEINVYDGIMYLTFESVGHNTKTFTKSLISSDYTEYSNIPAQVLTVFSTTDQDGTEKSNAYSDELQYFKQGAYNQTNGKDPDENMVWYTGSETYGGDLEDQYANGSYAEVWFKEATVGDGEEPTTAGIEDNIAADIRIFPNPAVSYVQISLPDYSISTLRLYNNAGQCVINKPSISGTEIHLDLNNIESGSYYLVIENEFKHKTIRKIIKQ